MDLNHWVKVFDRLLPRSRVWSLIFDRTLKKFFHGLSILPKNFADHIASVLLEAFPQHTSYLYDWSWQFGSPTELTADELEAEWAAFGGQDPDYIQTVLHDAGFTNLFVHEWWVPGTTPPTPPVARNPIALVPTSRVLVNDLSHVAKHFIYQFGDGSQFVPDESVSFGRYDRYYLVGKWYPCPDVPNEYPSYYYVTGYVWPNYAIITESQLRLLLRLIYKTKPVHLRCILRVTVVADSVYDDIQDTTWSTDEIQDAVSAPDDLQDHS